MYPLLISSTEVAVLPRDTICTGPSTCFREALLGTSKLDRLQSFKVYCMMVVCRLHVSLRNKVYHGGPCTNEYLHALHKTFRRLHETMPTSSLPCIFQKSLCNDKNAHTPAYPRPLRLYMTSFPSNFIVYTGPLPRLRPGLI